MEAETALATPASDPTPTPRGIGIKDVLCIGPIIANSVYYYVGIPLTPLLIGTHPVLLSALRGSLASMVASGGFAREGKASLLLALIAPIPISMVTDPFFFWAGRRYGRRLVDYLVVNDPRWRRRIALGERFFRHFGVWAVVFTPVVLILPNSLIYVAAGEARMRFLLFILADLAGTLLYIGLIVALGWSIGEPAVAVAQKISSYALWVIIGSVVLVIGYSVWTAWRAPRNGPTPG